MTNNEDVTRPSHPAQSELFFQSHNRKGTETILLIHGACGSSKEWDDVIPHLTDKNYHVLAPDLPMHGQSISIKPFNLETAATQILHIISEHAHNGSVHLVGLSLGAHIGASVAERAAPGQISSAILSGYNSFHPPKMLIPFIMPPIFILHHTIQLLTQFQTEIKHLQTGESSFGVISEVGRILCDPRPLGKIPVRTLVVAAQKDSLISAQKDNLDAAKKLFAAVDGTKEGASGSRVVLHRGILHAWHISEPVLFGEMVYKWVGEEKLSSDFEDTE